MDKGQAPPSLDPVRYGNHKGRSATRYFADLRLFVLCDVELGRYVNLLMVDYGKAFDKVDITLAMEKLWPCKCARSCSYKQQQQQQ